MNTDSASIAVSSPTGDEYQASAGAWTAPAQLSWAVDITADYVTIQGARIRYITCGQGPTLVLLHTLRTQLDMFQRVIPRLADQFRIYALDYPGHGHSDAPDADYSAQFFVKYVEEFLDRLNIEDAILVGESIGGTIALLLAARHNSRVRGVVAVNPYDYGRGRGLRRSSLLANLVIGLSRVPLLGQLVKRKQPYAVVKRILRRGVSRRNAFPSGLLHDLYVAGNQPGHLRAFEQLVRHWASWEQARDEYKNITLPVFLLYGDDDWSRETEREANRRTIPQVRIRFIEHAGHFLALDAPAAFEKTVVDYTQWLGGQAHSGGRISRARAEAPRT